MRTAFISYRRDDSQGFAGRLEDDLSERFGDAQVFRDREIPAGSDFVTFLESHLAEAEVVLVVIGRDWLDAHNAQGERRLDLPGDWVRREIERALEIGVPLVPVLVGGALMPSAAQLPTSIAALARRQAFALSDRRWSRDIDELAQQLQRLASALQPRRDAPLPVPKPAPRPGSKPSPGNSLVVSLARWLAGRLGKLFGAVMSLAVIYILVRALGGAEVNHMLDKVIFTVIAQFAALLG